MPHRRRDLLQRIWIAMTDELPSISILKREHWTDLIAEIRREIDLEERAGIDVIEQRWPYWGDSPNGFDGPGGAE